VSDRRITLVLLIAVVVALASGLGVYSLLRNAQSSGASTVTVVVAARDVADGHVLSPADVQLAPLPEAAVPDSAFTSPDSVIGRVTRIPVLAGEALIPARLAPVGAGGGLEVRIGRGKRAMPVRIEDAAASVIQPNSRVDVILITTLANGAPGAARLILSNKRVLSVGGQMERIAPTPGAAPAPTATATIATIEVTPAEAERLAVAMTSGRIQFVLRGYGDLDEPPAEDPAAGSASRVDSAPSPRVRRRRIGGIRVPVPPPAAAAATPTPTPLVSPAPSPARRPDTTTVQVFRGPAVTRMSFPRKDTIRP